MRKFLHMLYQCYILRSHNLHGDIDRQGDPVLVCECCHRSWAMSDE